MSRLVWSDDYSIGNEEIDNQHKKLIDILDNLTQSLEDTGQKKYINKNVLELQHYAVMHFSTEELYMFDMMYVDMDKHIIQHDFFRAKVKELNPVGMDDNIEKKLELVKFITGWLLNHVLKEDKKIPFIPTATES
jgi:hemerythrin-like metal-binding protein